MQAAARAGWPLLTALEELPASPTLHVGNPRLQRVWEAHCAEEKTWEALLYVSYNCTHRDWHLHMKP